MTDAGNTEPLGQRGSTAADDLHVERDAARGGPAEGDDAHGRDRPDPVAAAKDPDNRAKLLLAAVALTLLNTLLLVGLLATVLNDPGREEVVVDGVSCIVADGDGEDNVLYCQR